MGLVLRLIVNAVALLAAAWIVPGIELSAARGQPTANEWLTLLLVALIFGLVNAIIRPVVVFLTFPITVLTLGLFIFVINALMLILTSWIAAGMGLGFRVNGFVPALLGALIISVVSFIMNRILVDRAH
jgi:putative membrane protein